MIIFCFDIADGVNDVGSEQNDDSFSDDREIIYDQRSPLDCDYELISISSEEEDAMTLEMPSSEYKTNVWNYT